MSTVEFKQGKAGKARKPVPVAAQVTQEVETLLSRIRISEAGNRAPLLAEILVWQELVKQAKKKLEKAWESELIPSDEELRELGEGEHSILSEGGFTALASVKKPGRTLKADLLISDLVRFHKFTRKKAESLLNDCREENRPSLSKRIVEVE
jgi:hypothetical protein